MPPAEKKREWHTLYKCKPHTHNMGARNSINNGHT
jgi:hypothetical protein